MSKEFPQEKTRKPKIKIWTNEKATCILQILLRNDLKLSTLHKLSMYQGEHLCKCQNKYWTTHGMLGVWTLDTGDTAKRFIFTSMIYLL